MADVDPVIRRIERTALIWCGGTTVAALALRPDLPSVAAGIVGGGVLTFISLFAIRATVDAVLAAAGLPVGENDARPAGASEALDAPATKPRAGLGSVVKVAGRLGLVGLAAYVMIARLRLHPVGLLIGASSLVAGATLEAVRSLRRP